MKLLIVNADDFGYTNGVNTGIIKAHSQGIVTSTSLMVYGKAAKSASQLSKFPNLSVGLHFQIVNKNLASDIRRKKFLGKQIIKEINKEFIKQLGIFRAITGNQPTHLDSHLHIHTHPEVKSILLRYSKKYSIPVRHFNEVKFFGEFYERSNPSLKKTSNIDVKSLIKILSEFKDGIGELMCHPGIVDKELLSISKYSSEREKELETLTDIKISNYIKDSKIKLVNWTTAFENRPPVAKANMTEV